MKSKSFDAVEELIRQDKIECTEVFDIINFTVDLSEKCDSVYSSSID